MATMPCMEKQDFKHFTHLTLTLQSEHGQMGLQAVYQPNVNSPSTSLTPQVQPGVNESLFLMVEIAIENRH